MSEGYRGRMVVEYQELLERYSKLRKIIAQYDAGTLGFEPKCPIQLLQKQAKIMEDYLFTLEVRAELEDVPITHFARVDMVNADNLDGIERILTDAGYLTVLTERSLFVLASGASQEGGPNAEAKAE